MALYPMLSRLGVVPYMTVELAGLSVSQVMLAEVSSGDTLAETLEIESVNSTVKDLLSVAFELPAQSEQLTQYV